MGTAIHHFLNEIKLKTNVPHGIAVSTSFQYFNSISFPDELMLGLNVEKIGRSSVNYQIGVFKKGSNTASAVGTFKHVYVDDARKPTEISNGFRDELDKFV